MVRKKGELRTTHNFFAWEVVEPLIRDNTGHRACFKGRKGVQCVINFVLDLLHLRCL